MFSVTEIVNGLNNFSIKEIIAPLIISYTYIYMKRYFFYDYQPT